MAKNNGWIKLHRGILDWEWYHDPITFRVFIHLLLIANYEDNEYRGILLKRGQCIISYRNLAEDLQLTLQHTRTAIRHLISTHEITLESTHNFSVVTIANYEEYQGVDSVGRPVDNFCANTLTNTPTNTALTQQTEKSNTPANTLHYNKEYKETLSKNYKNNARAREEADGSTKTTGTALEIEEYITAREAEGKKVSRAMMEVLRYREMNEG